MALGTGIATSVASATGTETIAGSGRDTGTSIRIALTTVFTETIVDDTTAIPSLDAMGGAHTVGIEAKRRAGGTVTCRPGRQRRLQPATLGITRKTIATGTSAIRSAGPRSSHEFRPGEGCRSQKGSPLTAGLNEVSPSRVTSMARGSVGPISRFAAHGDNSGALVSAEMRL